MTSPRRQLCWRNVFVTFVVCTGTMASGEEDGTVEEKETNNKKRTKGAIATAWLTFYNIAMTAGWLVLAVAMVRYYLQKGTHKGLYRNIARTLKFFQTFALLEVGHCAIGIVRTSVIVTGVQVCSRIFMVWFVTNSIRQNEESVILFVVVWTITEITRYSFYTFNLLNHLPYFIKWARYKCGMSLNLISQQQNCMAWFHLFTLHGVVSTCLIFLQYISPQNPSLQVLRI
ncbi:very-long-chain (3R)-3-hydroxyacyl-CoA dehydratase 1-like isoform X2 [Cyprinus carpio]|uniref:Very-long-chain (3R)-3-hydroxyacyl-CoA dehydratase n=1 Tax=Cyprinus carpio TaxID=7962 RepID=A0A9Q9XY24_CYPCA|nr:very-long-chain (3R)-3-hydroxyacyl-CoA dehydratase 1-like isoform X2 [Cyprinus carpio]